MARPSTLSRITLRSLRCRLDVVPYVLPGPAIRDGESGPASAAHHQRCRAARGTTVGVRPPDKPEGNGEKRAEGDNDTEEKERPTSSPSSRARRSTKWCGADPGPRTNVGAGFRICGASSRCRTACGMTAGLLPCVAGAVRSDQESGPASAAHHQRCCAACGTTVGVASPSGLTGVSRPIAASGSGRDRRRCWCCGSAALRTCRGW